MRLENTSRLMRPKLSHEKQKRPLSAAVEPDPFTRNAAAYDLALY